MIDTSLLFGVVVSILGSMFIALLCSLPAFVLDFFVDLGRKKHFIFLFFAFICAFFMASSTKDSGAYFIGDIALNLFVVYFGLFFLKALKNMGSRFGMCKICDKLKKKFRRKNLEVA